MKKAIEKIDRKLEIHTVDTVESMEKVANALTKVTEKMEA